MPGTPPLGPAALVRVRVRTPPRARRAVPLLIIAAAMAALAVAFAASPARAQAPAACPSASDRLGAAPSAIVEAAVSCLVNAERAERGLSGVAPADALEVSAQR